MSWTGSYRVYRVSSHDQWALASLVDTSGYLRANEAPAFKGVAGNLLHGTRMDSAIHAG